MKTKKTVFIMLLLALHILCPNNIYSKSPEKVNEKWQKTILAAVDSFPEKGGYYVGRKTTADFPKSAWRAMNEAFIMFYSDFKPSFNPQKAQPSFCSMATYAALLKALIMWDSENKFPRQAWYCLKPLVGVADNMNSRGYNQKDGEGCWGRANANGPGLAVLVNELKAGVNFHGYRGAKTEALRENAKERYLSDDEWRADPVWDEAIPGDFMKIFWNRNETNGSDSGAVIGENSDPNAEQEHGHSVIFMGYTEDGKVKYWSSNGPGENPKEAGYGIGICDKTRIQRVVITRITNPDNFANAKKITPVTKNKWLVSLAGEKHGTTQELKKECGIK